MRREAIISPWNSLQGAEDVGENRWKKAKGAGEKERMPR
jgi:hypothetical protein